MSEPTPERLVVVLSPRSAKETMPQLKSFHGSHRAAERRHRTGKDHAPVNDTLYGTTSSGGQYNQGAVYKITTSGKEQVLQSFKNVAPDGSRPAAAWAPYLRTPRP